MASKAPDTRTLPSKEATLFRQLVKHYESKQYKKGIKAADTILKKFPEHGETLAMKGLLLNCLERKEEAYELVKRGVKNDIRSHVCWHVYGLLYRSDREYDEAIKCYKNALRMDKDNLQVLRDLALLQIQMRDLPGFLESRQQLLDLKPSNKQSWVAFALAHQLCGHHEVAAKVLDAYQDTLDEEVPASEAYEHSELLMYKARILEEAPQGLHAEALAVLDAAESKGQIKDRLGLLEARGRLFLALERWEEAEGFYRRLVAINPDNHRYHHGLLAALRLAPAPPAAAAAAAAHGAPAAPADLVPDFAALTEAQRAQLAAVYAELAAQHPHSAACKRLPLDFLSGEAFEAAAEAYARRYVAKGIPSLFRDLRPLYSDPAKRDALGKLFKQLERSLLAEASGEAGPQQAAGPDGGAAAAEGQQAQQQHAHGHGHAHGHHDPLLWVRLYLAQHADLLGDTSEALRLVEQCLEMSPLLIEAHSVRARVLRHAGDLEGAARAADKARSMDLSDRYLNCLAVKALFRAGHVEAGEKVAALFTRDGELANNLFDMQAMWYEIHSGRAFLAKKDYGRALKRFLKVDSHFADFVEDQFDFHGYCLRKQTMRAYVDMLRMEDKLYAHPIYSKAMSGAVQAYLDLFDHPPKSAEELEGEALAGMSAEEQKKYRQRKRKEEQRKQKEAADAAASEAAAAKKGDKEPKKKDPDPDGVQLAATPDPLGEAAKLVKRLCEHAGESLATHLMAFEVYLRKGRPLLALRAVKHALRLAGAAHPRVHLALLRLAQRAAQHAQQPTGASAAAAAAADGGEAGAGPTLVGELLQQGVESALGGLPVEAYHQQWAAQHGGDSLAAAAAVAEGTAALQPEQAAATAQGLLQAASPEGASHADCVAVHELLRDTLRQPSAAEQWRERCAGVLRWSRYFGGREVVPLEAGEAAAAAATNGVAEKVAALAV